MPQFDKFTTDSVSRTELLKAFHMEDTLMYGRRKMQTEIPTKTAGKEMYTEDENWN